MLLFRLIAAFLAINIAATVPLWFGERSFPPAPLLLASRNLDAAALLFGSLFLLFGCLGLGRTMFRWLFLACAFVLICSDQNRLQPWFYQYAVLLFLLWELRAGETQRSGRDTLLAAILGTIYF